MIKLTQVNGELIVINSDLISFVRAHPHTVVTLTNGDKLMVEETPDEVIQKVIRFKRNIYQNGEREAG
ncbi:MAG: endoflagellar protein [Candidatus Omnitrophica bacterium]|nr:endoflagellar protein [Candidatus Omnitrophota bacterium]